MRKRWNANTWVVVILFTLIGLIGIDVARQMIQATDNSSAAPPPPASMDPEFKVGDKAPDFTLPDAKGTQVTFSKLIKGDTMLWFTCGCNNCLEMHEYMGQLSKRLGAKAPTIINVTTMLPDREETWLRDTKLKQTILYEPNSRSPVGLQYKGHPCPRYFEITADQKVATIGPSPQGMPDMTVLAMDMADDLGFARPGVVTKPGGLPPAPMPKFRDSPTQSVTPPAPPGAAKDPAAHSEGDGHDHSGHAPH